FVDRDGSIVPTTSVGNSVTYAALAKKVFLEINTAVSEDVYGIHDIYHAENYPHRNVIPIVAPWNKIGRRTIPLDPDQVIGIVFSDKKDNPEVNEEPGAKTEAI